MVGQFEVHSWLCFHVSDLDPEYQDFFSRGLEAMKDYWPIRRDELCPSIKYAVKWGNDRPDKVLVLFLRFGLSMHFSFLNSVYVLYPNQAGICVTSFVTD